MPNLGSLWYQVMLKDMTDADLQKINAKLKNLGVEVDTSKIRQSIEASVGATPFNATVTFGNARASIDAALAGTKQITVEAIASKLHESINAALAKYTGNTLIVPKKKELRKAVNDALLSSGFEINIGKVKGLATTINNALGSDHSIKISVDSRKLADAIDKAVKSYKGGTQIPLEAKEKVLHDSIRKALRSEKFPIKVIVDKAEAQDAVRQALQAAGLQSRTGFTASDKRAWDAQSRRMEAEARGAAASALAQRRLAGAHRSAQRAVDSHIYSSISLGSAMRGNIRIAGELGPMLASAYSVVALKNFMQKVIEIGGELEKQKLAMNAILGDEGFANTISSQINTLAVKSPFGIMELNQYAKQLTAFQIPYNELYDTMKRMADVSAAVGVDMGRIILAYGQVRAAKFLKGCLGKGTLVTMLNGSQKKVENVVVGDVVMGDDEKGRNVLSLIRNREMMYVVSYHGGSFRCNENHILTMYDCETGKIVDVCVLDYLKDADKYLGVRRVNGAYEYFGMTVKRDCVDDYYGFEIDGNKRFLIEDNVVTHNTELRQFTEANIPLIDMLAERFTKLKGEIVSAGDIMDMISNKEVSFEDVKAVLWELTGEGGRFYNMQEVLSESVQAKWKNLADAIDLMFADIAESVSGPLKSLAELLTELTSRWKTIAAVVANGAIAFGVAKVATLAWNAALSKTTLNAIKEAGASKQIEAANLRVASTYRTLTSAEQGLIRTKGRLTAAQYVQLAAEGKLTKEQTLRLIALKKLDANTIGHLRGVLNISKAEVSAAQATSAWRVRIAQLGSTMRNLGRSLTGFFLNPLSIAMAAIGAMTALWQKNNEEMAKAKEIGDNVATSASEGFKNLKSSVENFKPGEGLTDVQLTQGIEQMQQLIKDYSPTPIEDINNALVAQDGHIHTLVEQYEILRERINSLKDAYQGLDNRFGGQMVEGALKATDGGNWFTQLFDDNLAENAKDYTNALGRVTDRIAKYSREYGNNMKNAVIAALNADERFRNAVSGMTSYDEKLRFLAEHSGDYYKAMSAFNADMNKRDNGKQLDYFANSSQIQKAHNELLKDTDKFITDYNSRMQQQGINPFLMTPQQKTEVAIAMKSMLAQLEDAGEDAKAVIAKKLEDSWGLAGMIIEDKIGPSMQEKFRAIVGASTDEGVKMAVRKLQYEGYDALSDAEKKTVKKLMEQAKTQTMADLDVLNKDMQNYLTAHPLSQIITLSYQSDKPSALATELIKKHGYPGLTESTNKYVTSWTKSNSVFDARNNAQSALQQAKNELDAAKKAGAGIAKAQKEYDEIWAAIQYLGWGDVQTKDQKSNKHTGSGSKKDSLAESLKQRFKDIKDAWSEFQKWQKLEGTKSANSRIAESGLFSTLDPKDIPTSEEDYLQLIRKRQEELKAAGIKGHKEREALWNDLAKAESDVLYKISERNLKLALDKVSKESERQLENWNLYDKVRKATGDKQLAMNLAFEINTEGQTDYVQLIKDRFNAIAKAYGSAFTYDAATPEKLQKEGIEEVQKAYKQTYADIGKYHQREREEVADMVAQHKSTQEEIIALTEEAEEKKRKIRENENLSPVEKQQVTDRIDADLNYEVFRKSGEYLKFFNAVLSMTGREAEKVGHKIKAALDDKLKAGQISAKDYCEEMERINKQLDEIHNKQKGFGGLGSFFKGGLNQMFQDRYKQGESDHNTAVQDYKDAKGQFDLFSKQGNQNGMQQAQSAMDAANAMKKGAGAAMQGAQGAMSTMQAIDMIVHGINDTVQGFKGAFDLIKEMADSTGTDTGADTAWGEAGAFLNIFSEASQHAADAWDALKSGNIGGVIQGVVGSITSWFTGFNRWHDQKLQEQIEKSKQIVQNVQYAYDAIERRMTNFLGHPKNIDLFNEETIQADIDDIDKQIAEKEAKLAKLGGFGGKGTVAGTLAGGTVAGPYGAIAGFLIGGIVDIANGLKRKRLEKELNELYEQRERLEARMQAYREGGAPGLQRQMMKEQLAELEQQKADLEGQKKKDKDAIKETEDQIDELTVKIREFAMEQAKELYGIDLKDWAKQLGDTLFDAWKRGEDGAEAFRKKAGDIIGEVMNNILRMKILEPMMEDVADYLFGEDGESGALGKDFELTPDEVDHLAGMIMDGMEGIDAYNAALDQLEKVLNEKYGLTMKDEESKSGLSAGIQSVTEDTADLLASYLNAIRADVSEQTHVLWPRLLDDLLPQMNVIAESQLRVQIQIAENTMRNAVAAEAIVKSNDEINRLLARVTQGGAKFYIH